MENMKLQNLHSFNSRLVEFIKKRVPRVHVTSKVIKHVIQMTLEGSSIFIDPDNKAVCVGGTFATSAYGIGKRMDIHLSHWLRNDVTTLICADKRDFFEERLQTFLTVLSIFPDLDLTKYFEDKVCVAQLRRTKYTVDAYVTDVLSVLIVRDPKDEWGPLTREITNMEDIEKIKNADTAEETMGNEAEKAIEEDEKKKAESKAGSGPTMVTGDSVEGQV